MDAKHEPIEPAQMARFLDAMIYAPAAFLVDEVVGVDQEQRRIEAVMDTTRPLPIASLQRGDERLHPRHVSAPELILLTGNLGCLHAWFLHGCYFDEGWVGFGNRIWRADFRDLVRIGPPLELQSTERRTRVGERRVVMRIDFRFHQGGKLVYSGDQSAIFVKDKELG